MLLFLGCTPLTPAGPARPAPPISSPAEAPGAVLLDDIDGLRAGTPLDPIAVTKAPSSFDDEPPVLARVRADGREFDLPARSVALREGPPLTGDLDGDGLADRVWRASSLAKTASGDEVYPRELRQVVVAEVGGRVLVGPERVGGGCSGEGLDSVALVDATGDGRLDVVVTADSYVCEAGYDRSTWEVLRPRASHLDVVGSVTVPRYPLVGRVNVGHVWWWPGGVRAVVIEPASARPGSEDEGPLRRTERRWTWTNGALVASPPAVGALTATLGGARVEILSATAGDDTATIGDERGTHTVPRASLAFADAFFLAELDGAATLAIERADSPPAAAR